MVNDKVHDTGHIVVVKRTGKPGIVVESEDALITGKIDHAYRLDDGTHYWHHELRDATPAELATLWTLNAIAGETGAGIYDPK